jgi:hypothetical protein
MNRGAIDNGAAPDDDHAFTRQRRLCGRRLESAAARHCPARPPAVATAAGLKRAAAVCWFGRLAAAAVSVGAPPQPDVAEWKAFSSLGR